MTVEPYAFDGLVVSWWTALWTALAFGAAALAVVVNVFGLRMLWHQLRLNRAAVDLARESAEAAAAAVRVALAESRPWLRIEIEEEGSFNYTERTVGRAFMVSLTMTVKNVGHTPALGVRFFNQPIANDSDAEIRKTLAKFRAADDSVTSTLFPGEERVIMGGQWVPLAEGEPPPYAQALVAVEYRTAVGDQSHWTAVYVSESDWTNRGQVGLRKIDLYITHRTGLEPT